MTGPTVRPGAMVRVRRRVFVRTLRSLRHRDYRLFLAGQAVSVIGTWMQRVGQDWLVLQLTDDGVALGVSTALQFAPTLLLGLWGGALVDRLDRRRTVIVTQAASAALAAMLAALTLGGAVRLWMVYALALGLGLVTVVDTPARQALLTEKVPPEDFINAQALNSTVHNTGRLVGPALAAVLITVAGVGAAFAVNAVSFVAVLVGLVRMGRGTTATAAGTAAVHLGTAAVHLGAPSGAEAAHRPRGAAREGLRYVLARPEMTATLLLVTVIALFGQNFRVVLPLLARNDLHSGAAGYGALTSALGFGAVVGALVAAGRDALRPRALVAWAGAFGVVNGLAALAPGATLVLLALVGVGIANITFNTLARTLLQLRAEPGVQGRVIALHGLVFLGTTPIGGPLLGWWCGRFGARAGLGLAAVTALLASVAVLPVLRRTGLSEAGSAGAATSSPR